jgi:hypothetical protein
LIIEWGLTSRNIANVFAFSNFFQPVIYRGLSDPPASILHSANADMLLQELF